MAASKGSPRKTTFSGGKRHLRDSTWAVKLFAWLTELSWSDVCDTCASSRHFYSRKKAQKITTREPLISGVGFKTVQHAFSHSGQLLWTSADPPNSSLSSGGRFIAAMVRSIRPDVIDTGTSNRQSPQLAHGQLRELIPRRQCQWCFLRDIDVLTEHERQLIWVQELTTNQLLKWQEVCKSIAR